ARSAEGADRLNRWIFAGSGAFLLLVFLASFWATAGSAAVQEAPGARVLRAAREAFEALGDKGQKALFEPESKERWNWHFIPRDRQGVPLKDLSPAQREKV